MLDHLGFGVSDVANSKRSFVAALAHVGIGVAMDVGLGKKRRAAALAAGGQHNGGPGLRPHDHANHYAAFVIGPDGHNVEAVCHAADA